jgi:1,4-dihydroxy-2-naphthoate polyprenyltransferase
MQKPNPILGPMRLPFLILAPVCAFLAISVVAYRSPTSLTFIKVLLVVIGSIAAHISVNTFNEYFDFKSGLDFKTIKTPFSGGSGALPASPDKAKIAFAEGIISALVVIFIGIYFIFTSTRQILPLGLLGLVIIITYTVWINRIPFLCLISPGVGFGLLMVAGSGLALSGVYSYALILASFIPFFLVSNLLLLNQFPDVEADKMIGRLHYPILIGRKKSAVIYGIFMAFTYVTILVGVALSLFPLWTLLGLLTLILSIPVVKGVYTNPDDIQKLIPLMGQNVLITLVTPVLVGIGFLIG